MCRALCVLVIALFVGLAHSWEIVISVGDRLEFYTISGIKRTTVHYLTSHVITALAYDEVHESLLFVDKRMDNDTICGYNLSSLRFSCIMKRNGRDIQGLAFDPVTEIIFFTDRNEKSINWYSLKPESKNNAYGNLLIKTDQGVPTDIAVDSCRGYIYWINRNVKTSSIERARLNGSEREVVINVEYTWDLHSLVIDQQKQKLYWSMPDTSSNSYTYSADLDGKNIVSLIEQPGRWWKMDYPNSYTLRKKSLYVVEQNSCLLCVPRTRVKKYIPSASTRYYYKMLDIESVGVVGIAANYKMKDHFQGISDCNHIMNNSYKTDDLFKIGTEYVGLYCVHGTKVNGQSLCECVPGYTGERCEVSLCENYCLHGNCSFSEQGFPKCRCETGFSGERCEINACYQYCSNNGTCSLTDEAVPVCECVGEYTGGRCEIPVALNYGDGSQHEEETTCQCVGSHGGSGQETDKNKTITSTSRL